MRKITKMFVAMALMICCAISASAATKTVLQFDFEGENPAGPAWGSNSNGDFQIADGALQLLNNETATDIHGRQLCLSAPEPFEKGGSYTVIFRVKGDEEGFFHAFLQYTDQASGYPKVEFPLINFTTEYTTVKVRIMNTVDKAQDLMIQWGDYVGGNIYIDDIKFTVYSEVEEVYTGADPSLRWANVLTNSTLEGTDPTSPSFWKTENDSTIADSLQTVILARIDDAIGVEGSRGIKVTAFSGASTDWDAQFFIAVPEPLVQNTALKVAFDYRASTEGSADTQAHKTPGNYIHYSMIGSPSFTTEWQHFNWEGKLSSSQAGSGTFQSIAFNLAKDKTQTIEFFFDNIEVFVQNNGMSPQYGEGVILLDLMRPTNISQLVAATGKSRLVYPEGTVELTKNGEPLELISVEAYADGRLYAFVDDILYASDVINVKFTNPEDAEYHIVYTDDNTALPDYDSLGYYNLNVTVNDAVDWLYAAPKVMSVDPADGSFNLPADLSTVTVKFDIPACTKTIKAAFGGEQMTVATEAEYAEEIKFVRKSTTPLEDGEYELNIYNIRSETGDIEAYWGDVTYLLSIGLNEEGTEVMEDLAAALITANNAKDAAAEEIYSGEVYDGLCALIEAYDEEYKALTSAALCRSIAKDLVNTATAMNNHRALVDNYYSTVNGAISARDSYKESKFAVMDEFVTFVKDLTSYLDENGQAIKLYDDAELTAAVNSLSPIVNNAAKLFTTGPSKYGTTGIAALVERLRLGAETLKALGVAEDDELIVAVNNALTDDDKLAEQLKHRAKLALYTAINEGKTADLFKTEFNEETEEFVSTGVDLTVFFKNPNIYISSTSAGGGLGEGNYNAEYMPGWTVPEGANTPKYSVGPYNAAAPHEIADGTFLQWQSSFQIEQTVIDLPNGVYTIKSSFSERTGNDMNSVFYVKTSATADGEFAAVDSVENKGDTPTNDLYLSVNNIVVTDGVLTVGALAGAAACCHFNAIAVEMTGAAEGFDYKQAYADAETAYNEFIAGIAGVDATANVLGIELYDLNGRRINKAQEGVVIVKKYMSDGTIVVDKVIK